MMSLNLLAAITTAVALVAPGQPVIGVQLDTEFKSTFGGNVSIEITSKVTKSGDSYTYMYSIKNTGKHEIKFKWGSLSKAMQYGMDIDMVVDLKPGENLNFVLEHPDEPSATWGSLTAYYGVSKPELDDILSKTPELPKGVKMKMPNRSVLLAETFGASTFLPKSYITPANPFFRAK